MSKIVFFGQGKIAAKTLSRLSSDKDINLVYVVPRQNGDQKDEWFDGGTLADAAKTINVKIINQIDVNDVQFVNSIRSAGIDLIVNLGHGQLFKRPLIDSTTFGILNYHPGLLPYGRGSGAAVGEIINGEVEVGRTCHLVDEKFDLGRVINQQKFSISETSTLSEVSVILQKNVVKFIHDSVKKVLTTSIEEVPTLGGSFGRYFPKFVSGDEFVDWNDSSRNIANKIRSRLNEKYAVVLTKETLEKILISKAEIATDVEPYISVTGQVIDKSETGILVKTGDTAIWIREIFNEKSGVYETPSYKIGTCFQTLNISDFISCLSLIKRLSVDPPSI